MHCAVCHGDLLERNGRTPCFAIMRDNMETLGHSTRPVPLLVVQTRLSKR